MASTQSREVDKGAACKCGLTNFAIFWDLTFETLLLVLVMTPVNSFIKINCNRKELDPTPGPGLSSHRRERFRKARRFVFWNDADGQWNSAEELCKLTKGIQSFYLEIITEPRYIQ